MDTRRVVRGVDEKPTKVGRPKKSKSPARTTPPVKSKSPSRIPRSKSPARVTRARSKSPARVTRKPSPSRAAPKSSEEPTSKRLRAKGKVDYSEESSSQSSTPKPTSPKIILSKVKVSAENSKLLKKVSPKAGTDSDDKEVVAINNRRGRLNALLNRLTPSKGSPVTLVDTPTASEQSTSQSRSTSVLKDKEFSDSEENSELPAPKPQQPEELDECGGRIGSGLHILLVSLLPIALFYHCRIGGNWNLKNLWEDIKNPYTYCNNQSGSILTAFTKSTWLLSLVPIGKFATIQSEGGPLNYRFNGLFTAVVVLSFLFGLEYKELDVFSAIYDNIDRLLYINVLNALLLAGLCYVHTKYAKAPVRNPYGNTNKFLIDFFAGTEINPRIFKIFDIKMIAYHQSVIFTLILNVVFIYKNITFPTQPSDIEDAEVVALPWPELIKQFFSTFIFYVQNAEFNKLALVVSSLLVLYSLDLLVFEHHLTHSFELTLQGTGASNLLRFATFPFCLALLPKFLLEQQLNLSCWVTCLVATVFMAGLFVKRLSSTLKYNYRQSPYDQKYKDLQTLPTFQTRRLIISSWWKYIRYPNYLGEIISHFALLLIPLCFKCHMASFIGISWIIVYLVHNIPRLNRRSAKRYETTWPRYSSTIKYNLIPKIF